MSDTTVFRVISVLSVIVFLVVVILHQLPQSEPIPNWAQQLPMLNAIINGTCTLLLVGALVAIKKGNVALHKKLNIATFVLSSAFLISYIIFHSYGVETTYPATALERPFYLFILITHIVLAALVLPLVLASFYFGLKGKFEQHRKLVRFSFPIWLYVTMTGVIVYLMISPYYRF